MTVASPTPTPTPSSAPAATSLDVWGTLWTLVRTDFKVRYHGTVMGFFWALLKPLAMLSVLLVVFSYIFKSTQNYAIDLVIGIFIYEFFQDGTKTGITSLAVKGYLLNRSPFPQWILVVASICNALIALSAFTIGVFVFLLITGNPPSLLGSALYFFYVFLMIAIVIGFSLAASVLFVRYRDLNQIWEVVVQMGFFFTPVIWPLEAIPERYHIYFYIFPPTPVLEFSRSVLTSEPVPSLKAHLLLIALALTCLGIGVLIYQRFSPRVAEHL